MSWAKSVLPMFTGDSSEKLRIAPDQVQIDTTHFRPQAPPKSALSRTRLAVNRTAVKGGIELQLLFVKLLLKLLFASQQLPRDDENHGGDHQGRKASQANQNYYFLLPIG